MDNRPPHTYFDLIPPSPQKEGGNDMRRVAPKVVIPQKPRAKLSRVIIGTLGTLLLTGILTYGAGILYLKNQSLASKERIQTELERAEEALERFAPGEANASFAAIRDELRSITTIADRLNVSGIIALVGQVSETVRAIPASLKGLTHLSEAAIGATATLDELKVNGFSWFAGGEGTLLIQKLEDLSRTLDTITTQTTALEAVAPEMVEGGLRGPFLPFRIELETTRRFLESIITWLKEGDERHILVFFQNPSELRPAGGFLGSYAEITLAGGALQNTKVWDIYDPDGQLDLRIIPPRELQFITPRWGARDANWFFDFPTSAKKTIELLEASKIYSEQSRTFDGAVAININVLKTLLAIVGPIPLPEYGLVIDQNNFLVEIQREVESGEDNKAGEPKRILKILTPLILEKLGGLTDEKKQELVLGMRDHFTRKDILLYFTDREMEGYLKRMGVAGDVYMLPEKNFTDYFALAEANVGGGKTDTVLAQRIRVHARIEDDGQVTHEVILTRTHKGNANDAWWYRAASKSYLKFFLVPDARLTYASGGTLRTPPIRDYNALRYREDNELRIIEATRNVEEVFSMETFRESGKSVFGTWMMLPRGKEASLEFHYDHPTPLTLSAEPTPYPFIFEKQSGRESTLELVIEAPAGYVWEETGTAAFTYMSDALPGRLMITPTLVPMP